MNDASHHHGVAGEAGPAPVRAIIAHPHGHVGTAMIVPDYDTLRALVGGDLEPIRGEDWVAWGFTDAAPTVGVLRNGPAAELAVRLGWSYPQPLHGVIVFLGVAVNGDDEEEETLGVGVTQTMLDQAMLVMMRGTS